MNKARRELCRKTSLLKKQRYIHSTNHLTYTSKAATSGGNNNTNIFVAPRSFATGMFGGTLGSFLGMGGGVFTIPIMTSSIFGLTQRQAAATNLVAAVFTGTAGAAAYAMATNNNNNTNNDDKTTVDADATTINDSTENIIIQQHQLEEEPKSILTTIYNNNNVQIDMAVTAAIAGIVTAGVGARLSHKLSEKALKRFLAGIMYMAAPAVHLPEFMESLSTQGKTSLLVTGDEKQQTNNHNKKHAEQQQKQQQQRPLLFSEEYMMTRLVPSAVIGAGAGIFSGISGLGGGLVMVSAFSLLTPLSYKQALGTSLFAMVFPATSAAITHHLQGNIVWRVAPFLAAGAGFGAFAGGRIGSNLPEKELKCCFSAAMLVLGTRVLLRALRCG